MTRLTFLILSAGLLLPIVSDAQSSVPLNASQEKLFQKYSSLLFFIQRTKNANLVMYYSQGDKTVSGVKGEWLNLAEDGQPSNILFYEKAAYGYSVSTGSVPNTKKLTLNSVSSKTMTIQMDQALGRPVALLPINGRNARLVRVFVDHSTAFFPTVYHYDLFGYDVETGEPVTERIMN